jgi:hypothetical protein
MTARHRGDAGFGFGVSATAQTPTRDAGVVSNRTARHRRGRATRTAAVEFDELDVFGPDELLCVIVDYHRSPLGAWTATLAPDGLEPVTRQAASAHDAFHDAMDLIEALSQYADVAISPIYTLDGEPARWATLAAREGFVGYAITDHSVADLITHN